MPWVVAKIHLSAGGAFVGVTTARRQARARESEGLYGAPSAAEVRSRDV